jgi:predicted nucleic acid-binding protein
LTQAWSLALRRKPGTLSVHERQICYELTELIKQGNVSIIGALRQEILTGLREEAVFERLQLYLRHFDDLPLDASDYELAAQFYNTLLDKGVVATPVDLLVSATAAQRNLSIFTTDPDFRHIQRHLPIRLYS